MVGLRPLVARLDFLSDASFLIARLMLPAEAPRAYSFVVLSMIMLWQHVGDLRPLDGITFIRFACNTLFLGYSLTFL